jgi:NitT/TauT family transport system substrate-binding protein
MKRRTFGASLVGATVLAGRTATAQPALETVRIAVIPSETAAVAYYASDLGYFQSAGIKAEFTTLQNGSAITAAVVGGSLDVGFSNVMSLIVAHDKGLPVSMLIGTELYRSSDPTDGVLDVAKTSPIRTGKDLNGKTIAVLSLSNTSFFALRNWIDRNGGDSTTVHFVETPIPMLVEATISGRVDAVSMDPGNAATAKAQAGLRRLAYTYDSIAPNFIAAGWFATTGWVQAHSDLAHRVTEALRKAAGWANAHPTDAVKMYSKYSTLTVAEMLAAQRPYFATASTPDLVQPVIDVAARYNAIKAAFPARDLLAPTSSL